MGRKVHPVGFRIGIIRDWQSKWYDDKHYAAYILEDAKLRKAVQSKFSDAGIAQVEIERQANKVNVIVHTSRPGIVIGRGGQRVEEMRQYLEKVLSDKKLQLEIREIRQPELDAYLVARSVAEQMERRVAYRRAMKQAIFRTMQAGAKGMRILCAGRLGGVEIARRQLMHQGRVPLQTLRADVDYGFTEAHTTMGRIGVKVWIYRGDIFAQTTQIEPVLDEKNAGDGSAVGAKNSVIADAISRMVEQSKNEASGVVPEKKKVTRKKAEPPTDDKASTKVEPKKKVAVSSDEKKVAKPRAVKAPSTVEKAPVKKSAVKTEEKDEAKPVKAKTVKIKPEAVKEVKTKAKKGE